MGSLNNILENGEHFNRIIQNRHSINGLILPTLVLPPQGREDYQTGNYENCAIWTGEYVAAQSLKFAATGDARARDEAKTALLALHKLQDITQEPGLIARGYKIGYGPTWDEDFFWKKKKDKTRQGNEWHQADNYRWLGDASKSQVFGVIFGYFAFYKFCNPTDQETEQIASHLAAIVNRILKSDMRIIDKDKKPTGYGTYSPRFPLVLGGIGPSLTLSQLKLAAKITAQERFELEYQRLVSQEDYSRFLGRGRPNPPILRQLSTAFGSEDNISMLNYYMLMNLETSHEILELCRIGLQRKWNAVNDPENSLFNFIYHASMQKETSDLEIGVDTLKRFSNEKTVHGIALKRKLPASKLQISRNVLNLTRMPIEERPIDEYAWRLNPLRHDLWVPEREGKMEFTGIDFLIAAYLGLYHGFIK